MVRSVMRPDVCLYLRNISEGYRKATGLQNPRCLGGKYLQLERIKCDVRRMSSPIKAEDGSQPQNQTNRPKINNTFSL